MIGVAVRSLFGVGVEAPLPGNGDTPLENVRAQIALLGRTLSCYSVHPDVKITMPDEIAPNHVLRWSTLEAIVAEAEARTSPADPADLVTWLRALGLGTVLIDKDGIAWQVQPFMRHTAVYPADGWGEPHDQGRDTDMRDLAKHAPFRVLHAPGGAS
jgi:hypothetical protein